MPQNYIKFKEPVYEGYENFSFNEVNYEIQEKDLKFLENSGLDISEQDFEKVIDVFEKIVVADQNQSLQHLQNRFYEKVPKDYAQRVPVSTLEAIYQKVRFSSFWCSYESRRYQIFLSIIIIMISN